jgi:hypothetical protein
MQFKKGTRVIECDAIQVDTGDVVYPKEFSDFLFLIGPRAIVFRMSNSYYCWGKRHIFIFTERKRIERLEA